MATIYAKNSITFDPPLRAMTPYPNEQEDLIRKIVAEEIRKYDLLRATRLQSDLRKLDRTGAINVR